MVVTHGMECKRKSVSRSTIGFMFTIGTSSTLMYNCSLSIFYLAVVRYRKSDMYIKRKLEPSLHAASIVVSIVISVVLLVRENYNAG